MPSIITYNVNGLRSAISKGFLGWLKSADPEMLCLQEIKAMPNQIDPVPFEDLGYHLFWHPAEKKGYSGVAIFSKIKPTNVVVGCGEQIFDVEGRILRVDFKRFSLMSAYFPSGSSGEERQAFKMEFLEFFLDYAKKIRKDIPNLVISGDYNICHKPIDIHNPKSNANSSGFLPEEREWMEKYVQSGFVDSFRCLNQEPHNYTWWSYRFNSRAKNLGWRIDYNMVSTPLEKSINRANILQQAHHSDHCPVYLDLEIA